MGMGNLIGAGVGFLGGLAGASAQNRHNADINARYEVARDLATPEHLMEVVKLLQPLMKELVAQGMGPAFQEMVSRSLATHGLSGTGVGESLRAGSAAMPTNMAFQSALGEAGNVVGRQIGVAENMPIPGAKVNPFINALMGAAQGYLGAGSPSTFGGGSTAAMDTSGPSWTIPGNKPSPATPSPSEEPPLFPNASGGVAGWETGIM